jgi:hypothetical protein
MRFSDTSTANMKRLQDEALSGTIRFEADSTDTGATGATHDPQSGLFAPGPDMSAPPARATLKAAQVANDRTRLATLGLKTEEVATFRVEADGEFTPDEGMQFVFPYPNGRRYTAKNVRTVAQNGVPQLFIVIGSA